MTLRRAESVLLVAPLAVLVGACGGGSSSTTLRVAAAASLTDVVGDLAERFEESRDGVEVEVNTGGSNALALQIEEGAPIDVFASADAEVVDGLRDSVPGIGAPIVFATNSIVIAVPGDPADRGGATVRSLDDFAVDEFFVGACAVAVPCGRYANEAFDAAGVVPALDSEEADVRALAAKVAAGDLDAGIVYRSDVVAAGDDLRAIELPAGVDVDVEYVVALVDQGAAPDLAREFVEFLTSQDAVPTLADAGFGAP